MTALLCDTSGLLAFFDAAESSNAVVSKVVAAERGPFVVSPFVLAELDYLLATRRGVDAELSVLGELAGGAWELPSFDSSDLAAATDVVAQYRDLTIGIADASIVVLAARYRTHRILTLDHRHFGVLRSANGARFELLPRR